MNYSVLKMENGILTYRQAPDPMPSGVGMDTVRDFLFWQNKLQIYPIKNENLQKFIDFMETNKAEGDSTPIPSEIVELKKDIDGKVYASMSNSVFYDANKGGIYALQNNCMICKESWQTEIGAEKSPLPFCTTCTETLAKLILKEKNSYGN